MSTRFVVASLVAVAAVAIALVVGRELQERVERSNTAVHAAAIPGPSATIAPLPEDEAVSDTLVHPELPERTPLLEESPVREFDLRVVDARTRSPVPNADVYRIVPGADYRCSLPELGQGPALFEEFGEHIRTDARGHARVRTSAAPQQLVGFAEDLRGELEVTLVDSREIELVLEPAVVVRVRAVDPFDQPVIDAPIVLRCAKHMIGGLPQTVLGATTSGPDGIATLHVPARVAERGDQAEASSAVWGSDIRPVSVDLRATSAEPVLVTVPEYGSVDVVVERTSGNTSYAGRRLTLSRVGKSGELERGASRVYKDDGVSFPRIALGLELVPDLVGFAAGCGLGERASGPTHAGERVTLRIAMPETVLVSGMVANAEGWPLVCDLELDVLLGSERATLASSDERTDNDGRFKIAIPRPRVQPVGAPEAMVLCVQYDWLGPKWAAAEFPLPDLTGKAEFDLGVLRLVPVPAGSRK